MTNRRTKISLLLSRLLTLFACVCMGEGTSLAQVDTTDHLQIIPPPVSRYRQERPAFVIKADPAQKPLPPTRSVVVQTPADPEPPSAPEAVVPSKEEIEKRQARIREIQRQETEREIQHEHRVAIGKALVFILVVLVGLAALADIVRQFRNARRAATIPVDTEDDEWEP
jgi:hypothetical protein